MRDVLDSRDEDLVFPDRHGRRLDSGNVNRALATALDKAELPRIRVHDLRHTAASVLLVSGVHPKAVQELLGHSTVTTTLNTYSHLTPLLHEEAISRLDAVLSA